MAYVTNQASPQSWQGTPRAGAAPAITMTLLRVVVGVIMMVHGFQKLTDIDGFQAHVAQLGMPLPATFALLAIAAEFLGGLGLIVGLLTRVAAFGVFCTMAIAVFVVHWDNGLLASNKGFEYPLTLLCAALFFVASGAGPLSLDAWLGRFLGKRVASVPHTPDPMYERPVVAPVVAPVSAVKATDAEVINSVDEASMGSFVASDPPARSAHSLRDHIRPPR